MLTFFSCTKPNEIPVHMVQLTPIDEEPSEDENNDEDQPITMIPKIMHTAPSPTTDNPPISKLTTSTVNNEQTPKHGENDSKETEPVVEVTIESKQLISEEDITKNGLNDREVSQIESVL